MISELNTVVTNKFTTIGPVKLASYEIVSADTTPNPGDNIRLKFHLTNQSSTVTAKDISVRLRMADTLATTSKTPVEFGDIVPGGTVTGKSKRTLRLSDNYEYPIDYLPVVLEIASADYVFWYDSITLVVDIEKTPVSLPFVFSLKQNYPNPFNPSTMIKFQIPNSNFVTLEIYNLLGQKVSTLVNEKSECRNAYSRMECSGPGQWGVSVSSAGRRLCGNQETHFTEVTRLVAE